MGEMSNAHGSKWCRPERRLALYLRDGFACIYCGVNADDGAALSLDHVLPRELGGSNKGENLVTACVSCNSAKRNLVNREWFAMLRDKGIDTTSLSKRIRAATKRPVDLDAGKRLLALRENSPCEAS